MQANYTCSCELKTARKNENRTMTCSVVSQGRVSQTAQLGLEKMKFCLEASNEARRQKCERYVCKPNK